MSTTIEVIKPGAQSQLQDLGRYGYQHLGVPVCGAMDEYSHRLANLLVGNVQDEATLEIVLMGPSLHFAAATQIAICGADLSATVDGQPVALNERLDVPAGALLAFGRRINGLRSYLAVRGGFPLAPLMGSRSTFVRGGFGGHLGRALRKGDVLQIADFKPTGPAPTLVTQSTLPTAEITPLRVVLGEHWAGFTTEAQALFAAASYRISPQSDRMGYRLEGPVLARSVSGELVSEAVNFGSIQVPPDGQPIVLMAERQSTGGYPKIAHVISVDLPLLAQLAPQQALRFVPVSLETAQTLYLQREQQFAAALGATR